MTNLRGLRDLTGWGLTAVGALRDELGSYEAAAQHYTHRQTQLAESRKRIRNDAARHRQPWWIRDFLERPITGQKEPIIREWLEARDVFRRELEKAMAPDIFDLEHLGDAVNRANAFAFDDVVWALASCTHVVPRFEGEWLPRLLRDPFERLRPLMRRDVAAAELQRQAVFSIPTGDERSTAIAESLAQAAEYAKAASTAALSVRPLLLFYCATALARAMVTPRVKDLKSKYGAHGLKGVIAFRGVRSLSDYSVRLTSIHGLAHALVRGLPGSGMLEGDEWSLLELCRYVPELADVIDAYTVEGSRAARILRWSEHQTNGAGLPGTNHVGFAVRAKWLERMGVDLSLPDLDLVTSLNHAFPSVFTPPTAGSPFYNQPPFERTNSALLQEPIAAHLRFAPNRAAQLRLLPLIYQGASDGYFYLVKGGQGGAPHPFIPLFFILYGMSMLVRYKPIEWSAMLRAPDASSAVLEHVCNVAQSKLAILATEVLLNRRFLGSTSATIQ